MTSVDASPGDGTSVDRASAGGVLDGGVLDGGVLDGGVLDGDKAGLAARLSEDAQAREWDPVTELVMRTFRLNGLFLATGESLAKPHGLTATRWQVLGAVLRTPLTVAGIAREMGLARQTVLPMAKALVETGLADYRENPQHRRAKLLEPTEHGRAAIAAIAPGQRRWARAVADEIGEADLTACVQTLNRVVEVAGRLAAGSDNAEVG